MTKFNERFRAFRAALKSPVTGKRVTLREMSEDIGIPLSSISKYEQGIIKPGVDILQKLGKKYGLNINWLVYEEGGVFVSADDNSALIKNRLENALKMSNLANEELAQIVGLEV